MSKIQYVLFMRHARHGPEEKNGKKTGKMHKVNATGVEQTRRVAERLKEHLEEAREEIVPGAILHATTREATRTAYLVKQVLEAPRPAKERESELAKQWDAKWERLAVKKMEELNPALALARSEYKEKDWDAPNPAALGRCLQNLVVQNAPEKPDDSNAIVVIGHQPVLGWLADAFVRDSPPLAHSEIICYALDRKPAGGPLWAISPGDDKTLEELREKIKKKMELAGMLGGFITAGIGFLIGTFAEGDKSKALQSEFTMMFLALTCLFLAVIFYLRTMFSYDSLLMPSRFWSETPSGQTDRPRWIVARPPSSAHWVLYQNMIHVWQWQFIPGTVLGLSGLFVLGGAVTLAALEVKGGLAVFIRSTILGVPLVATAVAVALPNLMSRFRYVFGPWLGSED